jgi:hypothetical protein
LRRSPSGTVRIVSGDGAGDGVVSGIAGGANWSPSAYDAKQELLFARKQFLAVSISGNALNAHSSFRRQIGSS